jgi:hypothetical protein
MGGGVTRCAGAEGAGCGRRLRVRGVGGWGMGDGARFRVKDFWVLKPT